MILARKPNRVALPRKGQMFVTDAGLETELTFTDGVDLPEFCAAVLLDTSAGRNRLRNYYRDFVTLAKKHDCGVILETPTWRLNPDWCELLGYDPADRRRINFAAVQLLEDLRFSESMTSGQFVVSGNLGPRFDGYKADRRMQPEEAADYHAEQIHVFRDAGADCVCAMTITNASEAVGIALAASAAQMPAVISFTLETDGRLPSGERLDAAIHEVDSRSPGTVAYFGLNCAHPEHFQDALKTDEPWISRIGSVRANASKMSHEELDNSPVLDSGDPKNLAQSYQYLRTLLPGLRVFGGCCGTDLRHITEICESCLS